MIEWEIFLHKIVYIKFVQTIVVNQYFQNVFKYGKAGLKGPRVKSSAIDISNK